MCSFYFFSSSIHCRIFYLFRFAHITIGIYNSSRVSFIHRAALDTIKLQVTFVSDVALFSTISLLIFVVFRAFLSSVTRISADVRLSELILLSFSHNCTSVNILGCYSLLHVVFSTWTSCAIFCVMWFYLYVVTGSLCYFSID